MITALHISQHRHYEYTMQKCSNLYIRSSEGFRESRHALSDVKCHNYVAG